MDVVARIEKAEINDRAEGWQASEQAYHERRRQSNQAAWRQFYLNLSDCHAQISAECAAKARKLLDAGDVCR